MKTRDFISRLDFALMVLGFAYLGIYSVDVLAQPPQELSRQLSTASTVIYLIFVADLIFRFALVMKTLNKLGGWIQFVKSNWLSILAVFAPMFRALTVLRVLLVLRGLAPYITSRVSKLSFYVGVALPLIVYTASISVLEAERNSSGSNISSFQDALWWSLVTVTTVGFGDRYPVTEDGRAIASFLIFVGIGLFSTLTAVTASWVLAERK